MWETVLVTGIAPGIASNGNPFLRVHAVNEQNEPRVWFAFGNERVVDRPDQQRIPWEHYDRTTVFSGQLHLLLCATAIPTKKLFRKYIEAVRTEGREAEAMSLELRLVDGVRRLLGDIHLEPDSQTITSAAEKVAERTVGRTLLIDWNQARNRGEGAPETHGLAFLPPERQVDNPNVVFANHRISTHVKKFKGRRYVSSQDSVEAARREMETTPDIMDPAEVEAAVDARLRKEQAEAEAARAALEKKDLF